MCVCPPLFSFSFVSFPSHLTLSCLSWSGFFLVFNHYGIRPHQLPFSADTYWGATDAPPFHPADLSYVAPYTAFCFDGANRWQQGCYPDLSAADVLMQAQTAYCMLVCLFVACDCVFGCSFLCDADVGLTGTQVLHIFLCKTRLASIITHGLLRLVFTLIHCVFACRCVQ